MLLLRGENFSSHIHKMVTWFLLGVLFKISELHPHPNYIGVTSPPRPPDGNRVYICAYMYIYSV